MPFTCDDLTHAFAQASPGKAVAPNACPNILLRQIAPSLAEWLWPILCDQWTGDTPVIPQEWKDAWLCLLAKRHVRHTTDIRPIALTDSVGKTILGLLTQALRPHVLPTMQTMPIFAFVPARGTEEALMMVFNHCRTIRAACEAQTCSFWHRLAGHAPTSLAGGAMLSLDMSQAFDRLPRHVLQAGFDLLQVPLPIARLFMHWLHHARYHISHRGVECSISSDRGVRQGCKASPLEWTIFLCQLMHQLEAQMPGSSTASWIKAHLITYADDLIALWQFASIADVYRMLDQITCILDTLQQVGMKINFEKTVILLRVAGRRVRFVRKRLLSQANGKQWLQIPKGNAMIDRLPIVPNHTYLGAKISYYKFEDQTLAHRLHIGRTTFFRLRPWLMQRHSFPLMHRIKLWQTCVCSSYNHGLQAAGLSPKGAIRYHRHVIADIRRIANSPKHITRETNHDLCARLKIDLPLVHLEALWTTQHQRRVQKWNMLPPDDFLHNLDIMSHFRHVSAVFAQAQPQLDLNEVRLCPYCDFTTTNQSNLTTHMTKVHAIERPTYVFFTLRDAWEGLPKCSHCMRTFTKFGGLHRHIVHGCCPLFDESCDWQVPLADLPRLRQMAKTDQWDPLWTDEQLLGLLRMQCVLCHKQAISVKSLAEHLHNEHSATWEEARTFLTGIPSDVGNPCRACGQKNARAHACPVLKQLAFVKMLDTSNTSAVDLAKKSPCQAALYLTSPMKRHKVTDAFRERKAPVHDFHPARDALDGLPQCAHCGRTTQSYNVLQRHIEDGSCQQFDKNRPIGAHVPYTWEWLRALAKEGPPIGILDNSAAKDTLSTSCGTCGQKLGNSSRIVPHLTHDHGPMMENALKLYPSLLDDLRRHANCSCPCRKPTQAHKCPVHWQALALHYVLSQPYQEDKPNDPQLEAVLQQYWTDPNLRTQVSTTCSLCQHSCDPGHLDAHLQKHDNLLLQAQHMLPLAQCPFLDCCDHCLHSAEAPSYCPVALNICGTQLRHGFLRSRGRLHEPDRGLSGKSSQHASESGQQKTKRARSSRTATAATIPAGPISTQGAATDGIEARKPIASHGKRGPIHTFFAGRQGRSITSTPSRDDEMEGGGSAKNDPYLPSSTPVHVPDAGDGDQIGQDGSSPTDGSTMDQGPRAGDDLKGRPVALPPVRPAEKEIGGHISETNSYGQTSGDDQGTQRIGAGFSAGAPLQMLADPTERQGSPSLPMAAAAHTSTQQNVGAPDSLGPFERMATPSSSPQATSAQEQPPSRMLGTGLTRRIPTSEAARACLALELENTGALCFVNATVVAFIWGSIQRTNATWDELQGCEVAVQELLTPTHPPRLALGPPGFSELRCQWGNFESQADSHEFLQMFLSWAKPSHVDVSWGRRLSHGDQLTQCDEGSSYMPPTLSVQEAEKQSHSFASLLDQWHSYRGMLTCFCFAAPMIGVHIDRYAPLPTGDTRKMNWRLELPDHVPLPFWNDRTTLHLHHVEYRPVAVVLHAGDDGAGHLRAGLKGPDVWYLTDDRRVASTADPQLENHLSDIVFVWMIRADCSSLTAPVQARWGKDDLVHQIALHFHQQTTSHILQNDRMMTFLRTCCGSCGAFYFSYDTLEQHVKDHHPGLWLELRRRYQAVQATLKCYRMPCVYCKTDRCWATLDPSEHDCMVALAVAVCLIHHMMDLRPLGAIYDLEQGVRSPGALAAPSLETWLNSANDY